MDNIYVLDSNGELYHWGIKGMQWGIRRFQNADGSLTAAGQKRYDDKLGKIEAKTAKLRAKQEAKAAVQARKDKLKAAKQDLENAKKGKKSETEKPAESDADKKARILKNPNAKDVYENRHLFSDNEVNSLYLRLNNERNIKNLVPAQVDKGKQFIDKTIETADTISKVVDTGSKTWNSVAKVYNSLFGNKNGVELPLITDKTASKLDKFKDETDWIKAKNDRKKAEKDANDEKSDLDKLKDETAQIKAENENRKAKHTRDQYDAGNWNGKEEKNKDEKKKADEEDDD